MGMPLQHCVSWVCSLLLHQHNDSRGPELLLGTSQFEAGQLNWNSILLSCTMNRAHS